MIFSKKRRNAAIPDKKT